MSRMLLGLRLIRENATSTNYHLGADTKPKTMYHGLLPLEAGSTEAFIGSKMTIGGITHETFHVIDRRFGGRLSVHYRYNRETKTYEGEGGLEWYLRTRVGRLKNDHVLGFNFGMVLGPKTDYVHLNEDSRASDDKWNQEIFPDVAAAVVFGLHEEDFFSKADVYNPDNRIGFANYNSLPYMWFSSIFRAGQGVKTRMTSNILLMNVSGCNETVRNRRISDI